MGTEIPVRIPSAGNRPALHMSIGTGGLVPPTPSGMLKFMQLYHGHSDGSSPGSPEDRETGPQVQGSVGLGHSPEEILQLARKLQSESSSLEPESENPASPAPNNPAGPADSNSPSQRSTRVNPVAHQSTRGTQIEAGKVDHNGATNLMVVKPPRPSDTEISLMLQSRNSDPRDGTEAHWEEAIPRHGSTQRAGGIPNQIVPDETHESLAVQSDAVGASNHELQLASRSSWSTRSEMESPAARSGRQPGAGCEKADGVDDYDGSVQTADRRQGSFAPQTRLKLYGQADWRGRTSSRVRGGRKGPPG